MAGPAKLWDYGYEIIDVDIAGTVFPLARPAVTVSPEFANVVQNWARRPHAAAQDAQGVALRVAASAAEQEVYGVADAILFETSWTLRNSPDRDHGPSYEYPMQPGLCAPRLGAGKGRGRPHACVSDELSARPRRDDRRCTLLRTRVCDPRMNTMHFYVPRRRITSARAARGAARSTSRGAPGDRHAPHVASTVRRISSLSRTLVSQKTNEC